MMEEEGAVIVGLLVGLNVIDANLCIKGEDLDSQVSRHHSRIVYVVLRARFLDWKIFQVWHSYFFSLVKKYSMSFLQDVYETCVLAYI